MHNITNVIISASLYGAQQLFKAQLDTYTGKLAVSPFIKIDKCAVGGDNCMRADLFVAAFNNLSLPSFIEFIQSIHYHDGEHDQRETLQVFIKQSDEIVFSVYTQDTINQLHTSRG